MQAPHEHHDGIGFSTPPAARDPVSESIPTPGTHSKTGIDPSDRSLQNPEYCSVGVGESRYTAGKTPVAKQQTEYDGLLLSELVGPQGLRKPSDGRNAITLPQVSQGFPSAICVEEMVSRQAQFFAAFQPKDVGSSAPARSSLFLLHSGLPPLVEGDDRCSQDLNGPPVPIACNHGCASAEALAHAALARHHDDLVFDLRHALRHLHALAHRGHDVRGDLCGLELFGHVCHPEDAESASREY